MTPCSVDACPNEAKKAGYCWGHWKRKGRGQTVNVPLAERPKSAIERLTEAALTYADAGDADEAEFERAKDNLRKAAAAYERDESQVSRTELRALQEALDGLKSKLGRPPKVSAVLVLETVRRLGGIAKTALELRVSVRTVQRAMRRAERHTNGGET